ncbi:MAG: restriction endonuclease subunit S [Salinivirgaceae bacterium]|nr:restriction endonuclease subunit S [Salinivirgaceae bacterium]
MPTYPTYKLGDILSYEQPTNYIVESTEYDDSYPTPVLTAGKSFILGYTNETKGVYDKLPVIIFDDFTTASQFVDFKFKVKSSAMKILSCNEELADIKYMYYLMQITHIQSDTHKRYWISDYSKIPIPLPPLTTQHAIVTRIENLFAELDKAVQHLRTAQQQLKTYRQAVLKAAFEGCENAEKHLFGELMADVRNGYGAKPTDCGTNKLLRISSVRAMNLNLDDFRFNNSSFDERDIIQENDLLFTRYNGSVDLVGVCAYVPELYDTYAYPDKIIRCRPKVCNTFHSKFLQYYINQGKAREFVRSKIKTTSGQNGISGSDIKKIEIPLPPLTEQQRIVNEIESRLSQATASETYIENALQQAEALRQSILKKAFSGELV